MMYGNATETVVITEDATEMIILALLNAQSITCYESDEKTHIYS